MTDAQQAIYDFGYSLAMLVLNPGFVFDPLNPQNPPIPVFQDQQDESAPTGLYVAVQGSPTITPNGYPYIEAQASDGSRGYVQAYTGTLILWEVNGNGSKLEAIREAAFLETIVDQLTNQSVTILDTSEVTDVSFKLDNTWKMQSRMTMTVSLASRITETLSYIQTAEITKV